MRKWKKLFDLLPLMLMWAVLSVLFWGWIFTFLTDAPPQEKLSVFVDAPLKDATGLALLLEEQLPAPIRMVQVRPFTFAMMSDADIAGADLYIVTAAAAQDYAGWFSPLPREAAEGRTVLELGGVPMGVKIFDGASASGAAARYIDYLPQSVPAQDYYLFFGAASLHVPEHEGALDAFALTAADILLSLP